MECLPWVMLGRNTTWNPKLQASPSELVFGEVPLLPGDLSVDPPGEHLEQLLNRLRRNADRDPVQTSMHKETTPYMPNTTRTASHVYVRVQKPTPTGPLFKGPYEIVDRIGNSSITVSMGDYANGKPRTELHSWRNCQPAHLRPGTESATAPKLGRKPLNPDASEFRG